MFGLIYKELVTRKKQLLIMIPIAVLFTIMVIADAATKDENVGVMMMLAAVCIILISGMFEQGSFENDETKKWLSFIGSAEDGIRKQIGSKYMFNMFLMMSVFTYLELLFELATAITGINADMFFMALQLMIFIQIIYRAIESPFMVAFGSMYGNTIRMIVMLILVFGFIVYALFGDLSIFGSTEEILKRMEEFLSDSGSYFILLMPICSLTLYYISYRISCRFYLHGGEFYEK